MSSESTAGPDQGPADVRPPEAVSEDGAGGDTTTDATEAGAATADPDAGSADPAEDDSPGQELTAVQRERDEYLDQLQRSRAEFANYKRRTASELAAARDRGAEELLSSLLGVLDNVGYVADAIADEDETPLAKGVRLVYADLFGALEQAGLEPIPGVGSTFDPEVHEALLSEASDEPVEEPVVVEVLRRGYRFKGRTLRPASVKVAR